MKVIPWSSALGAVTPVPAKAGGSDFGALLDGDGGATSSGQGLSAAGLAPRAALGSDSRPRLLLDGESGSQFDLRQGAIGLDQLGMFGLIRGELSGLRARSSPSTAVEGRAPAAPAASTVCANPMSGLLQAATHSSHPDEPASWSGMDRDDPTAVRAECPKDHQADSRVASCGPTALDIPEDDSEVGRSTRSPSLVTGQGKAAAKPVSLIVVEVGGAIEIIAGSAPIDAQGAGHWRRSAENIAAEFGRRLVSVSLNGKQLDGVNVWPGSPRP